MTLADAIGSLAAGTYTLIQRAHGGLDAAGRELPRTEVTTPLIASVQPASGEDLQRLPEGVSATDLLTVFTRTPLITADTTTGRDADVIVVGGEEYEVVSVEGWADSGGYYKATAQKARRTRP